MADYGKRRVNIALKWQDAEDDIKIAEHITGEICLAAVNELRYVGRHMSYAILAKTEEKTEENLFLADRHANRASYDAVDLVISLCLRKISKFKDDHDDLQLSLLLADYADFILSSNKILDAILTIRMKEKKKRNDANGEKQVAIRWERRPTDYMEYREHRTNLVKICEKIDLYRADLLDHRKKENRKNLITVAGVTGTALGLVLAIALAAMGMTS